MNKTPLKSVFPNLHELHSCELLGNNVNQNSRYFHIVKQYIAEVLQSSDDKIVATNTQPHLLTLGQLGFGDGHEILLLLAALQQANLQNPLKQQQTRIHISVFEQNPINRKQLEQKWQQQGLLDSDHYLFDFVQALLNSEIAAIEGCQRLGLLQNQFIIDLYQGSPLEQAKSIATPNKQRITHWFALPHTSQEVHSDQYFNQASLWQYGRLSVDKIGRAHV